MNWKSFTMRRSRWLVVCLFRTGDGIREGRMVPWCRKLEDSLESLL